MVWTFEYQAAKGTRMLNHGFLGVSLLGSGLWWIRELNKWVRFDDPEGKNFCKSSHHHCPKTFRSFKKYLLRHPELKGKEVKFVSRYIGYDITAKYEG